MYWASKTPSNSLVSGSFFVLVVLHERSSRSPPNLNWSVFFQCSILMSATSSNRCRVNFLRTAYNEHRSIPAKRMHISLAHALSYYSV